VDTHPPIADGVSWRARGWSPLPCAAALRALACRIRPRKPNSHFQRFPRFARRRIWRP